MPSLRTVTRPWIPALLAGLLGGCAPAPVTAPHDNQRPVVQFSRAPSRAGDLYSYTYEMHWTGSDPDGEVAEFRYAVDPPAPTPANPSPDTAWTATRLNRASFHFTAGQPLPPLPGQLPLAADYHVVVVKAVDNRGLVSLPAVVAFNASTIAPSVRITSPAPSSRFRQYLPPAITITWEGSDPDGATRRLPVHYRAKLLTASTPITPAMMLANADTLIRYYLPRNWATWDSLGGDATTYQFTSLAPDQDYAFAILAFDEAGAYTPYASGDQNVLQFRARYASAGGPILTLYNEFFTYTYSTGVYAPNDSRYEVRLEVPGNVPLEFFWSATAQQGTDVRYFRWVLDPEDLLDERPRANERTDLNRWSQPSLYVTSCQLPAFTTAGDHRLYVEVGDGNGLKSLGVIRLQAVVGTFEKPLGIVDDTRLLVDRRSPGATTCIDRPLGRFPTAAELDTFLYARGGVPIRCYPAGSVSRRGIFWGYEFDTLNTKLGRNDLTPSLSLLSRYRRLIWLLNADGADKNKPGTDLVDGMTALRYINMTGNLNVLLAYVRQGGEIWFAGGGAASAAINPFNVSSNDRPSRAYSAAAGELVPGRFVHDIMYWRSEFQPATGVLQVNRTLGRNAAAPGAYARFPAALNTKSLAAGDSMPAWRTNGGDFYLSSIEIETLTRPNPIVEDVDPGEGVFLASTLDTIYSVSGGTLPPQSTLMTVYHGPRNPRIIVSGFDLWGFRRSQLVELVDAVLQGLWGMTRRSGP